MTRILKYAGFILWILVASVLLTRFWLMHSEIFPQVPASLAEFLVRAYGAQNAEQVADLEILIGLSVSIFAVSLITLLTVWIVKKRSTSL